MYTFSVRLLQRRDLKKKAQMGLFLKHVDEVFLLNRRFVWGHNLKFPTKEISNSRVKTFILHTFGHIPKAQAFSNLCIPLRIYLATCRFY